jgi:hypothetical protein
MDYLIHYERLIGRARGREIEGYTERHHVVPRCLEGDDSPGNIVRLTPEEHYVAHQLLVKIHPGNHRLLWAASNMTGASGKMPGRKNKLYGWLRRRLSEEMKRRSTGRKHTEETRAKIAAAKLGRKRQPHSPETKAKMSAAARGVKKSAEHRAAMSVAKAGKKLGPTSDEGRKNRRTGIIRAIEGRNKSVGVYWCKQANKWKARINVNGKSYYLGAFVNRSDGVAAYEVAAMKFYPSV